MAGQSRVHEALLNDLDEWGRGSNGAVPGRQEPGPVTVCMTKTQIRELLNFTARVRLPTVTAMLKV